MLRSASPGTAAVSPTRTIDCPSLLIKGQKTRIPSFPSGATCQLRADSDQKGAGVVRRSLLLIKVSASMTWYVVRTIRLTACGSGLSYSLSVSTRNRPFVEREARTFGGRGLATSYANVIESEKTASKMVARQHRD